MNAQEKKKKQNREIKVSRIYDSEKGLVEGKGIRDEPKVQRGETFEGEENRVRHSTHQGRVSGQEQARERTCCAF